MSVRLTENLTVARPPTMITDDQRKIVKRMVIAGIPLDTIAKCMRIRPQRLKEQCPDEIECSVSQANAAVVGALLQNALSGNVSAQIFWCKTKLGWREVQHIEHEGGININFLTPTKKLP